VKIFIIGITGAVGGLLAHNLLVRGDAVHGLVRRPDRRAELESSGVSVHLGDLATMAEEELAAALGDADTVVFAAGSNAGSTDATRTIDGDGVELAILAAARAGVRRFALLSVLPEAWRERNLSPEEEEYFAVKKRADIALSRSDLDWLILRPSLLVDDPGVGTVSLGAAELHGQITRQDVAGVLAGLLHEPRIGRQILELNEGTTPIAEAVRANIRRG